MDNLVNNEGAGLREGHHKSFCKAHRGQPSTWSTTRAPASAKGTATASARHPAGTLNLVNNEGAGLREGHNTSFCKAPRGKPNTFNSFQILTDSTRSRLV